MLRLICFILVTILTLSSYAQVVFPLEISADHRHLVDKSGKPFPILGRTAWFIISQSEKNYQKFIENTIAHGHNAIEFAVITHWPTGNHAPFNGEQQLPFERTLNGEVWTGKLSYKDSSSESPDLTTPNERYWSFVDKFLSYCLAKNILVLMFPAYLGYEGQEQGWMKELVANGEAKTKSYGAWIANRYKNQPNILWMLLGDMGSFNEEQRRAEQALIDGLKSVRGQKSVHYSAESHSGENAADNKHFGNEMTLNAVYTWELKVPVPYLARKAYTRLPAMPAFLLEEPYDEEGPDGNNFNPNATQPVRRFQWWGWLSTIGGYVSGNGYVWPFIDSVWQQHLETRGAQDMVRLNRFIQSIEWWKLVPDGLNGMHRLITHPNNLDTATSFISAAASRDGSLLVAYIPPDHPGTFSIDVRSMSQGFHAFWFDPTNERYVPVDRRRLTNAQVHTFTTPGKNSSGEKDWVLILTTRKRVK